MLQYMIGVDVFYGGMKQPIQHYETSAKEATSVEEAFQTIAGLALQKGQEDDMYVDYKYDQIVNVIQTNCSSCCFAAVTYPKRLISVPHRRSERALYAAKVRWCVLHCLMRTS